MSKSLIQRDDDGRPFIKVDIQIPGRPEFVEGEDKLYQKPTHVQIFVKKRFDGPGAYASAIEIIKEKDGGENFNSSSWHENITFDHEVKRVTERVIGQLYDIAIRRLKVLRPNLFI